MSPAAVGLRGEVVVACSVACAEVVCRVLLPYC